MANAVYGMSLGAYLGAALNTSVVTSTDLVPDIFPIAINGKPYALDLNNPSGGNFYRRDSVALLRTQADSARTPGESSVSPEIFWRRSFDSWHLGAGQTNADRDTSSPYRFRSSKGMDVWTKGQLKALNRTVDQSPATANANIGLVSAGSRLYAFNANLTYFTSSTSGTWSWTAVTGTPASAPAGIASDGKNIWIAHPTAIFKTDTSSAAATNLVVAPSGSWTGVWFNKGKLFASTSLGRMYEIRNTATPTANLISGADRNTLGFTWSASTGVGGHHYFAGYNGDKSLIFKSALSADAIDLTPVVVAGELPDGETVLHLDGYLGYLIIGTSKGIRFANTDSNGYITIGGLIETGQPVHASEGQDRFVWFGWGYYDSLSSGLGRMDLAEFTSTLTPAYASDLMAGTPALNTSLASRATTAASGTGSVATITSLDAHGFVAGQLVQILGVTPAGYNGTFTITSTPSDNTLTYASAATGAQTVAGQMRPPVAIPIQGDVKSVATYNGFRVFAVAGGGIFAESTAKVYESELKTGLISHGIIDNKYAAFLDSRIDPLKDGSLIRLSYSADLSEFEVSGIVSIPGYIYSGELFVGQIGRNFEVLVEFGSVVPSVVKETDVSCTGVMLRSYPAPKRVSKFSVPIALFDSVNVKDRDFAGDPSLDFGFLHGLHKLQLPFSFQEGAVSYTVVMDDYQWLPEKLSNISGFQGTFVAVLREIL